VLLYPFRQTALLIPTQNLRSGQGALHNNVKILLQRERAAYSHPGVNSPTLTMVWLTGKEPAVEVFM
jgi:hypothetical protein